MYEKRTILKISSNNSQRFTCLCFLICVTIEFTFLKVISHIFSGGKKKKKKKKEKIEEIIKQEPEEVQEETGNYTLCIIVTKIISQILKLSIAFFRSEKEEKKEEQRTTGSQRDVGRRSCYKKGKKD